MYCRFVRIRRTGRPLKTCFLIALNTKIRIDRLPPMPPESRYWRNYGTHPAVFDHVVRLLPSKLRPRGWQSRGIHEPFAVNLESVGGHYRVTARSSPTLAAYVPRPPDRVYLHQHSSMDLPSYIDANRNAPPLYEDDLEAQRDVVYVEHSPAQ